MILFFGKLHDVAGVDRMACPLTTDSFQLSELVAAIADSDAVLGEALRDPSVRVAVNKEMLAVDQDVELKLGDEVAFMPPLSGG